MASERDSLCTNLALKEKENAGLQNTIADLTRNLIGETLSATDQFNKTLQTKTDELNTFGLKRLLFNYDS